MAIEWPSRSACAEYAQVYVKEDIKASVHTLEILQAERLRCTNAVCEILYSIHDIENSSY